MKEEQRKEIDEIIGKMKCPKNFRCLELDYTELCKAQDVDLEEYLECLLEDPFDCKFSLSFGSSYLCTCPLRVYIAKKLKLSSEVLNNKKI